MGEFVHLHVHTEYSLLDGACRIKKLVQRVKELGQTAVAITDHGCMYGVVDFYKECKKNDIKPIIGCEVYVAPRTRFDKVHKLDFAPYHLILLCKNAVGYQNLIKLVSAAYIDGFYNKPRVDRELLKQYHEGLICMSACLAGEIPRALRENSYDKARAAAKFYKEIFGEDYYIELQDHSMREQQKILPSLDRLARELDIKMVATNDAHYLEKEDAKMQSVLMCIQTNSVYGLNQAMSFETEEFYIKSYEEMNARFSVYEGAMQNSVLIADKCNFDFEFGVTKLPLFVAPNGADNKEFFYDLCKKGFNRRYFDRPLEEQEQLKQRLEYELRIITQMGYIDYFLIVYDFINYAVKHDIPVGPGRGSGAGSIAAYCIGITGIDPIRYNLLFERFLNPERVSMPDFDIDFCIEKRQLVIDYVIRKYGSDHVAQIITFGTMAAKAAIRDVGRALGIAYQVVDSIAKMVPSAPNITIEKALITSKDLSEIYKTDTVAHDLIDTAMKLEGMPRHASTHAAGVVITRNTVDSYVPLQKNDEAIVTQFPMGTLDELGLLKMDFLGLRNLTVIRACEEQIRKTEPEFDVKKISTEDLSVYEMLGNGDTDGVFQLESAGIRQVISQMKPKNLEDIIAVISLYRPGPMDSIPTYIRNRQFPGGVTYKTPLLKPILEVTCGCIVYQEQVMQICQKLAGYSYGRADLVRRAMAKKKAAVMEQERHNFIYGKINDDGSTECVGAIKNGVSETIATEIFDEMSSFASYAFNKSHAAAYALIAYQTAYLKYHYKSAYMAALMTSVLGNTDKVNEYIGYCKSSGIRVCPPNVNISEAGFVEHNGDINFGLRAIKNLGVVPIKKIIDERSSAGEYKSLQDFCERIAGKDVNKRAIEGLIKSGAMDSFENNRFEMLNSYELMVDSIDRDNRLNIAGQTSLFSADMGQKQKIYIAPKPEFSVQDLLEMEKETVGLYVSGHPLDGVNLSAVGCEITKIATITNADEEDLKRMDGKRVNALGIITAKKIKVTKKNATMAFVQLEDTTGSVEIIVFPQAFELCQGLLQVGNILVVSSRISVREDEKPKLICENVASIAETSAKIATKDSHSTQKRQVKNGIFIRLATETDSRIKSLELILKRYSGEQDVVFFFKDTKKYKLVRGIRVNKCEDLTFLLSEILEKEDFVWK